MGAQIDGIIGASLFKDFKITVNYLTRQIRIESSGKRATSSRKCSILPIRFKNQKPLVNGFVTQDNGDVIEGDFLIDSGSSDAIWLFDQHKKVVKTSSFFPDFLGIGINGDVFGDRGKIPSFRLGSFNLEKVKVAYPDSVSAYETLIDRNRIGSIGGELLRRFKITFDYLNKQLTLKRNSKTFSPFYYNLSGIELQYKGENLIKENISFVADGRHRSQGERQNNGVKIFLTEVYRLRFQSIIEISNLRMGSPAALAGLKVGDVIVSINNKNVGDIKLQHMIQLFQQKPGTKIKLVVKRDGLKLIYRFVLKSLF